MAANHWLTIDSYYGCGLLRHVAIALVSVFLATSVASFLGAVELIDPHGNDGFAAKQFPSQDGRSFDDSEAAAFDQWETIVDDDSRMQWDAPQLKPIDWIRHYGFRHSSSHGRHTGKGLPLEGTSVLNRPYHFDWFIGPLLGDDLISKRVSQGNVLLGGFRLGWDFDYYWGLEWRFGWADPKADFATGGTDVSNDISFVISDIDLVYYPWGDSKVRPYFLVGLGVTQLKFRDEENLQYKTSLASIPLGGGVQFRQSSWLTWRIDLIDNISLSGDQVSAMHNFSITAGMDIRLGARPRSYWPWRSSRTIW